MSVKLKVLSAGALFFLGGAMTMAQKTKKDTLKEKKIDEVVILGYGKTATKVKSVASSTTISAEKLENRASSSFLSSMSGTAPGITVNTYSGTPGSGQIDLIVRGSSSLSSTDPLFVIDGLMSSSTEFRNLNPNDIATLSILRDAQATAIYGNYGANGVVVITTKSGSFNSGVRVSYDATTNFSMLPNHKYDLMSSAELLRFQALSNNGIGSLIIAADPNNLQEIQNGNLEQFKNFGGYYGFDPTQDTSWRDAFTRVGFSQQHNIGIRAGGDNISSYTSLGYFDQEGVIKGTNFKRFTARTNINGKSRNNKFTYSSQFGLGYSRRFQLTEEGDTSVDNKTGYNPLLGIVIGQPFWRSGLFENGLQANQLMGNSNTFGRLVYTQEDILNGGLKKRYDQVSIVANFNAQYKILDWLKIANKTGVDYKYSSMVQATTPWSYWAEYDRKKTGAEFGGDETMTDATFTTLNSVTSIHIDKSFGSHSFGIAGYLDYLRGFYTYNYGSRSGLDPLTWEFGSGAGYIPFNTDTPTLYQNVASASKTNAGSLAYIGTLDYDYASRFGISATIRRDGSYKFTDENKWETFWSVGGRWNIDKENFMQGSPFNMLKLRASYGTNGNQKALFTSPNAIRQVMYLITGYQNTPSYTTSLKNTELLWEKVTQTNVGLDFGLFRNKIEGTIDVYDKNTSDLFLSIPISGINGAFSISGNNGKVRNRGIETSLKYTPFKNKNGLTLSVFANYSYNQSKVMELPEKDATGTTVTIVGGPLYQWNLYHYVGVNKENGNALYQAKNGGTTENPTSEDRILTGKPIYAPHIGGFGFDIDYKGLYLSTLFSYQKGGYSKDLMYTWVNRPDNSGTMNMSRELLNAWTATNNTSDTPSLAALVTTDLISYSDKYLQSTDFLKLKNLTIGYNLPKKFLENLPIKAFKIYAMGENLWTFTNWKGFDPEPIKTTSLGVYPNSITYTMGVNVEF